MKNIIFVLIRIIHRIVRRKKFTEKNANFPRKNLTFVFLVSLMSSDHISSFSSSFSITLSLIMSTLKSTSLFKKVVAHSKFVSSGIIYIHSPIVEDFIGLGTFFGWLLIEG